MNELYNFESLSQHKKNRVSLIAWLFVPLLVAWMSVNYIIGAIKQPNWNGNTTNNVLGESTSLVNVGQNNTPTPIPPYQWDGKGLVTLWFDDAWLSQFTVALPQVKAKKFYGALAVPTRLVGYDAYMSWYQVKKMQSEGWEITSHTRTHICDEKKMTNDFIDSELIGAKEDLEKMGLTADQFVTPCGVTTPHMMDIAKKYYASFRTTDTGFNPLPVKDPYHLVAQTMRSTTSLIQVQQWVKTAELEHTWLILMFHQIDDSETEYSVKPQLLQKIVDLLAKSNVHVVLPNQALQLEYATTPAPTLTRNASPSAQLLPK